MSGRRGRFNGDAEVLHQRAVRVPLPDLEAERVFHENMLTIAAALERKADLLADPEVTVLDAYEAQFDHAAESFERRLRRIVGDDYKAVARAYHRGDRDDRIGAIAAYYLEGAWRAQQQATITDMLYVPLVLRYPDSFTVNIRFASGHETTEAIRYESPEHSTEDLDEEYAETYYDESYYSQRRAASYLEQGAEIIREEFPDPDETPREEREYGGFVSASGRRGSVFSAMIARVEPDPGRFSEPVDEPMLVEAGPEARRTEREYFRESEVVH
ncbi:hypothetical protein A6E15_04090 [Natrinema saccharevitans]|uniref:Uncharacterized protein n=1 Tax=Natrinema saccharevitans TaxID=301967 RepID=A0A1S8AU75_9EURY|nr:hypothetical protein [Natrinema saccharevitans]OLZ40212.1 hypothetical protein A6E15_04090 [Natrinema saccharevitans]